MTQSEKIQVYARARQLLIDDGWCKYLLHGENGERCLRGALFDASGYDWRDHRELEREIVASINKLFPGMLRRYDVGDWNNRSDVDLDDVLTVLDDAIETMRSGNLVPA